MPHEVDPVARERWSAPTLRERQRASLAWFDRCALYKFHCAVNGAEVAFWGRRDWKLSDAPRADGILVTILAT
jgi:hypothetical protein